VAQPQHTRRRLGAPTFVELVVVALLAAMLAAVALPALVGSGS
jgi:Tfp pilus assembly protein PilE